MLHETTKKFMEGFRYYAHPMAMLVSTVAALVHRVSGREEHCTTRQPHAADQAPDRQDAFDRGDVLSAQCRDSLRVSGQRSDLHRKFHEHAVEDGRAEVRGESRDRARARHSFCSARRSRTELQHQRHARRRQFPGRSLPGGRFRSLRALRTAARRSQRRSAAYARRDWLQRQCPRLHQENQGRQRQADGLSGTASTRTTIRAPRSSSGPPTRCSK
jgi:hypothetical protein